MDTKRIAVVGLTVAATIVLGLLVYPLFPAPLVKLVLLAPFLGLTMAVPLLFYRQPITLVYVSASLAGILMFFSLFMGAAILSAGIGSYIFARFILGGCDTPSKVVVAAASFPAIGFGTSFAIIYYLLDIPLVQSISWGLAGVLFLVTMIMAGLGAHASVILFRKHIRSLKPW